MNVEERLMKLIRSNPPPPPATRNGVVEYHRERLKVLGVMDHPVDKLLAPKIIHVAGTKGKGSTCAFVESVLRAAGLRTGLYTSPHMVKVNERIRIGGLPVPDDVLEKTFDEVYSKLNEANLVPGFFSFLVLLSIQIFSKANLDVLILEVGLGGRLDATNIIEQPAACAVTLLDLDHTEILGNTIELIAAEKAGIFKKDSPIFVVSGQEPSALEVLKAKASESGSSSFMEVPSLDRGYELGLAGDYQYANAGLAVALCRAVFPDLVTEDHVREGLKSCRWPGRGQVVKLDSGKVRLYLDGAHTPKSVNCATKWLESELIEQGKNLGDLSESKNILMFNCMHTRNPLPMFDCLLKSKVKFDTVIFTPSLFVKPTKVEMPSVSDLVGEQVGDDGGRNATAWQDILGKVWIHQSKRLKNFNPNQKVATFSTLEDAVSHLNELRSDRSSSNIFVTGSLLLIGDLMKLMRLPVP